MDPENPPIINKYDVDEDPSINATSSEQTFERVVKLKQDPSLDPDSSSLKFNLNNASKIKIPTRELNDTIETKTVNLTLSGIHEDSIEMSNLMFENGTKFVMEINRYNYKRFLYNKYVAVVWVLSKFNPQLYDTLHNKYHQAVGALFHKYNKDTVFLLIDADENQSFVKDVFNPPSGLAVGVFPGEQGDAKWLDYSFYEDGISQIEVQLNEAIKHFDKASPEKIIQSKVPVNEHYQHYSRENMIIEENIEEKIQFQKKFLDRLRNEQLTGRFR